MLARSICLRYKTTINFLICGEVTSVRYFVYITSISMYVLEHVAEVS